MARAIRPDDAAVLRLLEETLRGSDSPQTKKLPSRYAVCSVIVPGSEVLAEVVPEVMEGILRF
jgi:hypothetical protein